MKTTRTRLVAVAAALAVTAAACGSGDDDAEQPDAAPIETDAADATDTTPDASEPATTAPTPVEDEPAAPDADVADSERATGEPAAEPSGDPVKIAFLSNWDIPAIGLVTPEKLSAAEAAAEAINASGGINGSPIELMTCNVGNDAPSADACARDAVEFGAVAVAGLATPTNGSASAILEEAGIPIVGAPLEPTVWASPAAYPLTAGTPGVFAGQAGALARSGATTVRFVATDVGPSIAGAELFFKMTAGTLGLTVLDTVLVPPDQTDMATIVQSAIADGVDGLGVILSSPPANIGFTRGLEAAGYSGATVVGDAPLTLDAMEQMPAGVLVVTQLNLSSPGGEAFIADMSEFAPDDDITPQAAIGWLAIQVIADVAADLDDVTPAAISDALATETALDLMGMADDVDFTTPVAALAPAGATRIFQTSIGVATIDGREFADGVLVNPFGPPGS